VDADLNPPGSSLRVVLNTAEAAGVAAPPHRVGTTVPVKRASDGTAFVEVRGLGPSECLVLINHP
jgi:hypothetical protein